MGASLIAQPLTAELFRPFGDVLAAPHLPGRDYFDGALATLRPRARPSLSLVHAMPPVRLPLVATQMERHQFSSQSFIPIDVGRWLVIVAPHAAGGGPDMARAKALLPGPGQGITFRADVWHHPLTMLDRPARLAIVMWLEGVKARDEEFFTLPSPVTIEVAD